MLPTPQCPCSDCALRPWSPLQEVLPELVATHCESAAVCDGHPFIVEAGVSIGGRNAKEGITVYRFANRIPLLFEGGGDVVTRTAMKRIKCVPFFDV
jgi:DNA topoisomerase VI subunit B